MQKGLSNPEMARGGGGAVGKGQEKSCPTGFGATLALEMRQK